MRLDVSRAMRRAVCSPPARAGSRLVARMAALPPGARILCHHSVNGLLSDRHSVLASEFALQMAWLARQHHPMAMTHLVDRLNSGAPLPRRTVAVTIDDGYLDAYTHAYPILASLGIPATFFVPVGLIGSRPARSWGNAPPQASFLDWAQMREMAGNGMAFGSHGLSHRPLVALSPDALWAELTRSRERLSDGLGVPVTGFAYPYGSFRHISPSIERLVAEAGYRWAVTAISGAVRPGNNPYTLRRILVQSSDRVQDLDGFLHGALDGWALIQRLSALIPQRG